MKVKPRKNSNRHSAYADEIMAAIDYGIDISMLIENLKRTPAERIRRHQIALNTATKLRKAKKAMNRPRDKQAILQLEAIKKLKNK
jgi:seryl-tRNA(Sec) selenium transferase